MSMIDLDTIDSDEDIYNYMKRRSNIRPLTLENLYDCLYIIKYLIDSNSISSTHMIDVAETSRRLLSYRPAPVLTGIWEIDALVGNEYILNREAIPDTEVAITDFIARLLSRYPVNPANQQQSGYNYNYFHDIYENLISRSGRIGLGRKTKRRKYQKYGKKIKKTKRR